ncbi:winged helix DNA-binding domain-containing protein [Gordonia phthalatica]|uniref:Winged helix DNA-binding domain-containing protein n=1 Tax=Gordonia phthalatica TaxID=1136941 RepID=A0A0N9N8R2_9ACTN|nr:winged helix DNA-binding domain-containing protein [Gordonia phthalatica]ALG83346.1 hypothetical protein ACH46_01005 [Gordonia phthalatica]
MTPSVSLRQWNRTLLHRQHLIDRVDDDAVEVIDRCVGLQSQDPQAAFFALEARVADFDPAELDELLTEREVVRMALHRGTVFLMDGLDARWMRPALQPVLDAAVATHARGFHAVTVDEVTAAAVEEFAESDGPVSAADLRARLAARWPHEPAADLVATVRGALPLVQVPPRGLWRRSGAPSYALLDDWIGDGEPGLTGDEAVRDLIRMYLRGFGPSTVAAIQTWSGLRGLRPIVEAMEADWELMKLTGPNDETLYDLEGLRLADSAVPIRFVAPYDNAVFAKTDRIRVADPDVYARTQTANGRSPGFVLVDGRLAATWQLRDGAVTLTELTDLRQADRRACEKEAVRLAEFARR